MKTTGEKVLHSFFNWTDVRHGAKKWNEQRSRRASGSVERILAEHHPILQTDDS